ncbi:hypothetical protein VTN31DRAFT_2388 [Thermomyces dupontii]|uniref:uncharacterized protein n=1 Tax=Talaromyces thermophilus TaxID=28565 RepID=UPI0037444609
MLEREEDESDLRSGTGRNRPDRYCVHRKDANADSNPSNGLIATVELKPPHKLSERHLRVGLRPMKLWDEVVQQDKIPTDKDEKAKRNAEMLTGSTLAQEYDVMLQEGLEFSYISNGLAYVFLQVRKDEPGTLYFYRSEPNMDMVQGDSGVTDIERTAIARVLCFCLMCLQTKVRDNGVRAEMMTGRQKWVVSFDRERAQIPREELAQTPPDSEYSIPDDSGSEFLPSSPPSECVAEGRRIPTRSMTNSCRSPEESSRPPHADSSDSDDVPAAQGRKRGFSQVTSSPTSERGSSTRSAGSSTGQQRGQDQRHAAHFCTQRCLLGLRQGGRLDDACPNVDLHRQGLDGDQHPIDAVQLVQMLKRQLDRDPDHGCTPVGRCGSYGAPFRITCATYGYTVIGKGTTSCLWREVSREAEIYRILQKVQGLAVPVFLGAIGLAQIYFLHGAGRIQHMLLMGWAGEKIRSVEAGSTLSGEISRSRKQLRLCGVVHEDLRLDNMLWNEELGRVLIIDFHRCRIDRRPTQERIQSLKKRSRLAPKDWPKRPRQDAESVHHG